LLEEMMHLLPLAALLQHTGENCGGVSFSSANCLL
jgi:hypothetical protein